MKYHIDGIIIRVAILLCAVIAGAAMLLGIKQSQQDEALHASRDTLQERYKRAISQAEAARVDGEIAIHMDSLAWRDYVADVVARTKAADHDSAQRVVDRAVLRARAEVLQAAGSMPDTSAADTTCRVWSTCLDDAWRRADDSLLRFRLDSTMRQVVLGAVICSTAVAQARIEAPVSVKTSSTPSLWTLVLALLLGGLATFFITH